MHQKQYLNYLKAFAIILVILGHCLLYYEGLVTSTSTAEDILTILIYRVHVPLFFVISGFLCHEKPLKEHVSQKFYRILIPFFTFSSLKLLYSNIISNEFAHSSSLYNQLFDAFIIGSLYWFCYCIFIFYLLAPIFWTLNKKWGTISLLSVLLLLLLLNTIIGLAGISISNILQVSQVLYMLPFFLFGLILQLSEAINQKLLNTNHFVFLPIVIIISAILVLFDYKEYTSSLYPFFIILSFCLMYILFCLARLLEKTRKPLVILSVISKYTYQIMLLDSFYKVILFKILGKLMPINILLVLVISIIDITLSCISCVIIKRIPIINKLFGL